MAETSRLQAFSDGIFTIAITLLILDIRLPQNVPGGGLAGALLNLWPSYLAFVTSFWTIGVMWINHHRLFRLIKRADEGLVAINLFLLLLVSWISFPTALLAQHLRGPDERIAAIVYSGTFVAIALVFNVLWWYARRGGHTDEPEHPITRQYKYGPVFYLILLAVGVFNATACLALSTLLAVYFALPPRKAAA